MISSFARGKKFNTPVPLTGFAPAQTNELGRDTDASYVFTTSLLALPLHCIQLK
jgi:hypothetical protein